MSRVRWGFSQRRSLAYTLRRKVEVTLGRNWMRHSARWACGTACVALLATGCLPKRTCPSDGGSTATEESTETEIEFPTGPIDITFEDEEWDEEETMSFFEETAECGDLLALEPAAMLGTLESAQITCLEDKLELTDVQTFKKRLSLILIVDSWSGGQEERMRWEALVRRHLEEFDRSDPDLCYTFARHVQRRGAQYADEAVRWADVALENKTRWSGDTYISRVYSLLKLKSMAAADVWRATEEKLLKDQANQTLVDEVEAKRSEAKVAAREWLDYARESGKDPSRAFELCVSAAGTDQYCGGS